MVCTDSDHLSIIVSRTRIDDRKILQFVNKVFLSLNEYRRIGQFHYIIRLKVNHVYISGLERIIFVFMPNDYVMSLFAIEEYIISQWEIINVTELECEQVILVVLMYWWEV